jgi:ABC-type branched-subunit amino acid transport system permease subunit
MVILCSSGTLIGPIIGAGIIVFFQQIVSGWTEHWVFYFGLLIVARILFFRGSMLKFLTPGITAPSAEAVNDGTAPRPSAIVEPGASA